MRVRAALDDTLNGDDMDPSVRRALVVIARSTDDELADLRSHIDGQFVALRDDFHEVGERVKGTDRRLMAVVFTMLGSILVGIVNVIIMVQ